MKNESHWGDPESKYTEEMADFQRTSLMRVEPIMTFVEGAFQARTYAQYEEILTHNGAPDIIRSAQIAVDAGCGGMTALAGMRRKYGPEKILAGFDVFNIPLVTVQLLENDEKVKGMDIIDYFDLQFIHGSYSQLPELIPGGYDALIAIPLFFASDWETSYPIDVFEKIHAGLRPEGRAQAIVEIPIPYAEHIGDILTDRAIPFSFTQGDFDVLAQHALFPRLDSSLFGTLTLGPKIA